MIKYKNADPTTPGEWIKPKRKYYFMQCCDCNLVHKLEFSYVKDSINRIKIIFRAWRSSKKEMNNNM